MKQRHQVIIRRYTVLRKQLLNKAKAILLTTNILKISIKYVSKKISLRISVKLETHLRKRMILFTLIWTLSPLEKVK